MPGADILVDGRVAGQTGESGNFEIASRTGAYRVSSARSGYEAAPATEQVFELHGDVRVLTVEIRHLRAS